MKKNNKHGFTLVELLAVIVILGLILVIVVPKVTQTINNSKKRTLELTVRSIAKAAEEKNIENETFGLEEEITCESISGISNNDYSSCTISFDEEGSAKVTIKGSGKFAGLYVCNGDKANATAINESCGLRTLTVELDGGTDTVDYNSKYEAGSTVILTEPTKEGYTFNGWKVTGAGASVNGNTLTMGSEATTITATWEEEQVAVSPISFSTDSWSTIVAAVKQAETNETEYPYEVGNEKTIELDLDSTVEGKEEYTIRVANKTKCSSLQTEPASKTACGFVLEFKNIIKNMTMRDTNTNVGGWPATNVRTYLNNENDATSLYNLLPTELRDGIISTYVVSSYVSGDETGNLDDDNFGYDDKLYLLSPQEVYGTSFTDRYDSSIGTSRQLDYYATYEGEGYTGVSISNYEGAIKIERSGSASKWWLRSAYSNLDGTFYIVYSSGNWTCNAASLSRGVSPAFRLAN